MPALDYKTLAAAVSGQACAFRARTRLQPADGPGGKIFPPTYLDGPYAEEQRRVEGHDESVPCTLLDSVPSNANRMELALQHAIDRERITMPLVQVDFPDDDLIDPVGSLSALKLPHRLADAILRDSLLDGVSFRKSELGKRLDRASIENVTPLLDLSPTSCLYGFWDSSGPKGGLGAKFQRSIVGEIMAYNSVTGKRTSSRLDPLQIRSRVKVKMSDDGELTMATDKDKKAVAPSALNHGNIPPTIEDGGITCDYAEHSVVLSLPALRRMRFPLDGTRSAELDDAGRTVLAAIGLMGVALATDEGFDLRSRCLLWPDNPVEFELLDTPGAKPVSYSLTSDDAIKIYQQAVAQVEKVGLPWRTEPVVLSPKPALLALLKASQEVASEEKTDEDS